MKEQEIASVWQGVRVWQPDRLALLIHQIDLPRTRHLCAVGGERFKETHSAYSFKFETERHSALMLRACAEHNPQLEEVMSLFQERLPELGLTQYTDPLMRIEEILFQEYDLHF